MNNAWYYDNFDNASDNPLVTDLLEKGYCIVRNSVSSTTIDSFLRRYEAFKQDVLSQHARSLTEGEDVVLGKYRRLVNLHLVLPELCEVFATNKALEVTDELFGDETTLYTSLYFEIGSAQDLHRDTPYFWTSPGYMYFGVWLALEDVDTENGALRVVPGSHKLLDDRGFRRGFSDLDRDAQGRINRNSAILWSTYQKAIWERCLHSGLHEMAVPVKKGDTIIWHPQLMHGGHAITHPERSRHSIAMHVTPRFQNVYAQDKYFDPDSPTEPYNTLLPYRILPNGRCIRQEKVWAIAQKIFLPVA